MEAIPELKDYQIMSKIGGGAYGSVFKALHIKSGKTVAVKVIKMKTDSDYVAHRHAIMVAREIYILYKMTCMEHNSFTILLFDICCNAEAYHDPSLLETIYLVTSFERVDVHSVMQLKS